MSGGKFVLSVPFVFEVEAALGLDRGVGRDWSNDEDCWQEDRWKMRSPAEGTYSSGETG